MSRDSIQNRTPFRKIRTATGPAQLKKTLQLIGRSIQSGSHYWPLIQHARNLATRAEPKDYAGQVGEIYRDFIDRWRYTKDPVGLETVVEDGEAIWNVVMGANAPRGSRGSGDCDEATAAIGSQLQAIGLPVRIATTSPPGSPQLFTHVFPQTLIPGRGWVSVDAVGHPKHGLGWIQPHQRIAFWNLEGKLIDARGNLPRSFQGMLGEITESHGGQKMGLGYTEEEYPDYGPRYNYFGLLGEANEEPEDLHQWIDNFGAFVPQYGHMDGIGLMEYDEDDEIIFNGEPTGLVRAKIMEVSPGVYQYCRRFGKPFKGAVGFADDGDIYEWYEEPGDMLGGFWKKLKKRLKGGKISKKEMRKRLTKGYRKAGKKLGRRFLKKTKAGRWMTKVAGKLRKVAGKILRPLSKYVGKYAARLAPFAAMIPGYGPAIAAALYQADHFNKLMKEHGVIAKLDPKTGKKAPKFKNKKQYAKFKKALVKAAKRAKKKGLDKKIIAQKRAGIPIRRGKPPKRRAVRRGKRRSVRQTRRSPSRRFQRRGPSASFRRRSPSFTRRAPSFQQRMPGGGGRMVGRGRLLRAGSKAHRVALRGLGADVYEPQE